MSVGRLGDPSAVRRVQIDDVVATYVVDGVLAMRPDTFLPDVPSNYWAAQPERFNEAGEMVLSAGGLLIERAGESLLIDVGIGPRTASFDLGCIACGALLDVLELVDRRPGDIDVVAFTHLHFDHAGWAFTNGVKTFPNARYVVAAREWAAYAGGDHGTHATVPEAVITAMASELSRMTLIGDDEEILPGVRAIVTPGHSPGHTSYAFTSSAGRRLIAFGDAFHVPDQLAHSDWISAVDTDSVGVQVARRRLITELAEPNTMGFGCHFGDQAFGEVVLDASGTATWQPVPTTLLAPSPFAR